jgi:hypothetical protein
MAAKSHRSECLRVALMGGTLTLMPEDVFSTQYAASAVGTVGVTGAGMTHAVGS